MRLFKFILKPVVIGVLIFSVYFATAVPVSSWFLNNRKEGVPGWVETAYIPLMWLRDNNQLADQFFTWQSNRIPLNLPPVQMPVPSIQSTGDSNSNEHTDIEARVKSLEGYLSQPASPPDSAAPSQ